MLVISLLFSFMVAYQGITDTKVAESKYLMTVFVMAVRFFVIHTREQKYGYRCLMTGVATDRREVL